MTVRLSDIAKAANPRRLDPMLAQDAMDARDAVETRRQRKRRYAEMARRTPTGLIQPYAPIRRTTSPRRMSLAEYNEAEQMSKADIPEPGEGYRRSHLARFNPRSETHVREGTEVRRLGTIAAGSAGGTLLGSQAAKWGTRGLKKIKPVGRAMGALDTKLSNVRSSVRAGKSRQARTLAAADESVLRLSRGQTGLMPRSSEGIARAAIGGTVGGAATTAAINRNTSSGDVKGYSRRTGAQAKNRIAPPGIPGYYYRY